MKVKFKNTTGVTYTQLKSATSTDELRFVLTGAYIDVKEKRIVVTDAHVLVTYPIEIIETEGEIDNKIVPIRYFNHLKYMVDIPNKTKRVIEPEYVLTDEYAEVYWLGELAFRCKYISGNYPNYLNIMPDMKDVKEVEFIGLNLGNLLSLTKAIPHLDSKVFKAFFFAKNKSIVLESQAKNLSSPIRALIMPALLED